MAAIGKIRQRSGLLIIIVGVALAAFVLGDLFKPSNRSMEYDPSVIGYINGEKISTDAFTAKVEEATQNYIKNQKVSDVSSEERYNIQLQVWEQIQSEQVLKQLCEGVGLAQMNGSDAEPTISMEEYADLLTGDHPHQYILQNFKNPETGVFDPTQVTRFLNSIEAGKNSENPKDRENALQYEQEWLQLEKVIKADQLSTKYYNLISKAYFVSNTMAKALYKQKNASKSVSYVGLRYNLVADSLVEPAESDYEDYYAEHKNEFKSDKEKRKIDYIVWNVRPSKEDVMEIEKNVNEMYVELSNLPLNEVASYVNRNSTSRYDSSWFAPGKLSPFIDSLAFGSEIGTVFSPWVENNEYHFGRLMDIQMRPDSMKASHILIAYAGAARAAETVKRTKIAAAAMADSLLEVVKSNPAEFGQLAIDLSDGPSGKDEGDLGWFADGAMVPEFNQACIEGNEGDFKLVETVFGYHIIHITGKKEARKKVRVALMHVPILFSQKTYEVAFNEASQFVSRARDAESFDSVSTNMALNVMHSNDLDKMANGISGVKDSRKIVQWLYKKERELGNVSDVFDFSDKLVVALYNENTPEGINPLDDNLKDFIKVLVMRDLKAKKLMEQYGQETDLNKLAQISGSKVDTMPFITFSAYSLQGYGPEPNVQGRMMTSPIGKVQGPYKGDQGVYFFVVNEETPAPENADYKFLIEQEQNLFNQKLRKDYNFSNAALKAIIDITEIDDFRQYFY